MPMKVTIDAKVIAIKEQHHYRDGDRDRFGIVTQREYLGVTTCSMDVVEPISGELLENLPCSGMDLKPGETVRITIERAQN